MPIKNAPLEVNKFVKGLVTEVSPLAFPPDASIDEKNFILDKTGLRRRRLGIDYESGFSQISPQFTSPVDTLTVETFNWKDVAGDSSVEFLVVQVGKSLMVYDYLRENISDNLLTTFELPTDTRVQMDSVDGILVFVNDESEITIIEYNPDTKEFTKTKDILRIRDQFGISSPYQDSFTLPSELEPGSNVGDFTFWLGQPKDLTLKENVTIRPKTITDFHLYNLRNQGWNRSRAPFKVTEPRFSIETNSNSGEATSPDPIESFFEYANVFPSNGDIVARGLIDDTNVTPPVTKLSIGELGNSPLLTGRAPRGTFVIDALKRGVSRQSEYSKMFTTAEGALVRDLEGDLPRDETPGGATCLAQFAGRVWFGGFSSSLIQGDGQSPRLSSYLLFSQIVTSTSSIGRCYQEADPTDETDSDLVDTDGGFVKLDGAFNIKRLINVENGLMVLADNGVWLVRGGDNSLFSATNYEVVKLTDQGCVSEASAVVIENTVMYWAENGIYHLVRNELGDFSPQNLTENTIQRFFENIDYTELENVRGVYDRYDKTVRWLYGDQALGSVSKELVLNLSLGAFYPLEISVVDETSPTLLDYVLLPPYRISSIQENVTTEGVLVTADSLQVTAESNRNIRGNREVGFVTLTNTNPVTITFSKYRDGNYLDWKSYNGVGVDAPAYAVTGYINGGDNMRRKQAPFLFVWCDKTENGFTEIENELYPNNPSSCMTQAHWGWQNSAKGNKWGRTFEAYRLGRFYLPVDAGDDYDTGENLVVTRNKLRGNGKTLSLKFSTSPGKDLRLYGWGMMFSLSENI